MHGLGPSPVSQSTALAIQSKFQIIIHFVFFLIFFNKAGSAIMPSSRMIDAPTASQKLFFRSRYPQPVKYCLFIPIKFIILHQKLQLHINNISIGLTVNYFFLEYYSPKK